MELDEGLDFARGRAQGVLVTLGKSGRPQLSNIVYALGATGVARISTAGSTVKAGNLRRDPTASLYVPGGAFWSFVVLDGTAELSAETQSPDDDVADELVEIFRQVRGEDHSDWGEFRAAMVTERRLVVRVRPERAYGQIRE